MSITASTIDSYFLWCSFSYLKSDELCKRRGISSSVPPVPNYVYVVIQLKMAGSVNSFVGTSLLYQYGETNDFFLVGGLVHPGETLTTSRGDSTLPPSC